MKTIQTFFGFILTPCIAKLPLGVARNWHFFLSKVVPKRVNLIYLCTYVQREQSKQRRHSISNTKYTHEQQQIHRLRRKRGKTKENQYLNGSRQLRTIANTFNFFFLLSDREAAKMLGTENHRWANYSKYWQLIMHFVIISSISIAQKLIKLMNQVFFYPSREKICETLSTKRAD